VSSNGNGRYPEPDHEIAIIGAGIGGLGMAAALKRKNFQDFVIFERADDVGGTWRDNTYPGIGVDVPVFSYQFSYDLKPDWSRFFPKGEEVKGYIDEFTDKHAIRPHIRFNSEVRSRTWDEENRLWRLDVGGEEVTARYVISAIGPFVDPKPSGVEGVDDFKGKTIHSARWDHDYDLTGKRVASIGTGASAIQYVPAIQKQVAQLHVFQRTAPWVMPHSNRPITDRERRFFRAFPPLQKLARVGVYTGREALVLGLVKQPRLMRFLERIARRHMRSQIFDTALREKVTPDYTLGCKRILPSNRWYPALGKPNVELVTSGVREIRANAIVGEDGVERPVDAIVFGTGFHVSDIPAAHRVRGRGGTLLDDIWHGSPRAYMGSTIAGFPNLFFLLGPNTGLGHSSMVYMIESQIAHVMAALNHMHSRGANTIEIRREAQDRYNAEIDRKLERTVWNTGCASWYIDHTGRNSTIWPDWTWRFRRRARDLRPDDYALDAAPDREMVPA
jgi:cation diffusion facilitator CzcD-associated flavoprotein CzcO